MILICGLLVRYTHWLAAVAVVIFAAIGYTYFLGSSDSVRLEGWGVALVALSPLGSGPGSFGDLYYVRHTGLTLIRPENAHNDPLQLAYEFGIGSLAIVGLFGMALRQSSHPEWPTAFAFVVLSLFFFPLYTPLTAFMGLVMAGCMLRSWDSFRVLGPDWRPHFLSRLSDQKPRTDLARSEAVPVLVRATAQEA